jgi:ketosteroid isomerase-like protein
MWDKNHEESSVARAFVECINLGNVRGLAELMTEDHEFVDAIGVVHASRARMTEGWKGYFSSFPDYRIEVEEIIGLGSVVAMFGWASGSFAGKTGSSARSGWRIPAAWKAIIRGQEVCKWSVYCDVEPMLRSMGINRF